MANLEVIALDESTPQLRAPGAGDGYSMPRRVLFSESSPNPAFPQVDLQTTWDSGVNVFTAMNFDVTDLASSSASNLVNMRVNGSPMLTVSKVGDLTCQGISSLGQISAATDIGCANIFCTESFVSKLTFTTLSVSELNSTTLRVDNGAGSLRDLSVRKIGTSSTTVANLGTPTIGLRSIVTDSTLSTTAGIGLAAAGGGANIVPVYANGTTWVIG
ncbi:MAG: hypothetical protein ACOYBQ_10320 [Fluviibacter sp.]